MAHDGSFVQNIISAGLPSADWRERYDDIRQANYSKASLGA